MGTLKEAVVVVTFSFTDNDGTAFLGWALIPLVALGVDMTLDPARFALLPGTRRLA